MMAQEERREIRRRLADQMTDTNLEAYLRQLNAFKRCDGLKTQRSTLTSKRLCQKEGGIYLLKNGVSSQIGMDSSILVGDKLRWYV